MNQMKRIIILDCLLSLPPTLISLPIPLRLYNSNKHKLRIPRLFLVYRHLLKSKFTKLILLLLIVILLMDQPLKKIHYNALYPLLQSLLQLLHFNPRIRIGLKSNHQLLMSQNLLFIHTRYLEESEV